MSERSQPKPTDSNPQKMPCPICGGKEFTWGTPVGVRARQDKDGLFSFGEGLRSRTCDYCGNVQLFLKYHDRSVW